VQPTPQSYKTSASACAKGVAALYREWVEMRRWEGENGWPGGWDKDGGPRSQGGLVPQAVKNFFLHFPRPLYTPPPPSSIFIPVFGLHPRSSWQETFLMNVRGLKGERMKKRNGRVKRKTKGIGAIRENIILFTSPLFFYLHLCAPAKRNSQTFVGIKNVRWTVMAGDFCLHSSSCDILCQKSLFFHSLLSFWCFLCNKN